MKYKLLCVADSIAIQKLVAMAFENLEFSVHSVTKGKDAISTIGNILPDIVVADSEMTEISGFELSRLVKDSPACAKIPVLLLTDDFAELDRNRFQQSEAEGYLIKPFKSENIVSKVKELLAIKTNSSGTPTEKNPVVLETDKDETQENNSLETSDQLAPESFLEFGETASHAEEMMDQPEESESPGMADSLISLDDDLMSEILGDSGISTEAESGPEEDPMSEEALINDSMTAIDDVMSDIIKESGLTPSEQDQELAAVSQDTPVESLPTQPDSPTTIIDETENALDPTSPEQDQELAAASQNTPVESSPTQPDSPTTIIDETENALDPTSPPILDDGEAPAISNPSAPDEEEDVEEISESDASTASVESEVNTPVPESVSKAPSPTHPGSIKPPPEIEPKPSDSLAEVAYSNIDSADELDAVFENIKKIEEDFEVKEPETVFTRDQKFPQKPPMVSHQAPGKSQIEEPLQVPSISDNAKQSTPLESEPKLEETISESSFADDMVQFEVRPEPEDLLETLAPSAFNSSGIEGKPDLIHETLSYLSELSPPAKKRPSKSMADNQKVKRKEYPMNTELKGDMFVQIVGEHIKRILERSLKESIAKEISGLSTTIERSVREIVKEVTPEIAKAIIQEEIEKIRKLEEA